MERVWSQLPYIEMAAFWIDFIKLNAKRNHEIIDQNGKIGTLIQGWSNSKACPNFIF